MHHTWKNAQPLVKVYTFFPIVTDLFKCNPLVEVWPFVAGVAYYYQMWPLSSSMNPLFQMWPVFPGTTQIFQMWSTLWALVVPEDLKNMHYRFNTSQNWNVLHNKKAVRSFPFHQIILFSDQQHWWGGRGGLQYGTLRLLGELQNYSEVPQGCNGVNISLRIISGCHVSQFPAYEIRDSERNA